MFYIRWCGLFLLGMGIGFTVLISVGRSWIPFIREIPVFLLTVVPLATVGIYVLSLVGGKWYVGQQARSVSDNLSRFCEQTSNQYRTVTFHLRQMGYQYSRRGGLSNFMFLFGYHLEASYQAQDMQNPTAMPPQYPQYPAAQSGYPNMVQVQPGVQPAWQQPVQGVAVQQDLNMPMPQRVLAPEDEGSVRDRLVRLEEMRNRGEIGQAEYLERKEKVLQSA
jgi:hypothetical protein